MPEVKGAKGFRIYLDVENQYPRWYVHFAPMETEQFRHGVTFKDCFFTQRSAEVFAHQIQEYFKKCGLIKEKGSIGNDKQNAE